MIPRLGRSPGGENGNSLQYSCLENPMDRGVWWSTVCGITRVGHNVSTKPPPPTTKNPPSHFAFSSHCPIFPLSIAIPSIFGRGECSHGVQFLIPILSATPCHSNCSIKRSPKTSVLLDPIFCFLGEVLLFLKGLLAALDLV